MPRFFMRVHTLLILAIFLSVLSQPCLSAQDFEEPMEPAEDKSVEPTVKPTATLPSDTESCNFQF